MEDYSFYST